MGSRERVRQCLDRVVGNIEIRECGENTKSSALAAQALGRNVAEIAKSVVFVGGQIAVVVLSGDKKVDPEVGTGRANEGGDSRRSEGKYRLPCGRCPAFPAY